MSVSSSLGSTGAPISFSGIASGLNTTSIIQELLSVDQAPITALQNDVTNLQGQQQVYTQLQSLLQTFQQSAAALNSSTAFNTVAANSSNTNVATISTDGSSLPGTYSLSVSQLAQAQMISTAAQSDTTSALGLSGTIVINGQSLNVSASDSLTTLAQNINGLNAGVTASLLNGGQGQAYLTLTASNTGAANAIQLGDLSGSVLSSLGFTNGTTAIRSAITNGAQSYGFSSNTATLQSLLGATASGSIQINGTAVAVNFATDSLQTIANNINANVSGVTASVVPTTNNGATTYQLQIAGTSGTPTFTDSNGILQSIGILQQGVSNQLVQAKDAQYSLDNVNLTSSSNTITTAIPGATLTLLQGTPTTPGTSTLTLSQNTSGIVSNMQSFVSAYNAVNDYINQNSQFNSSTYASGPLFEDPVADQVSSQLGAMIFQNVAGYTGKYPNLASLGFTMNSTGDLSLNTSSVTAALNSDPQDVAALFEATGTGSNSDLSYVGSNSSTVPSSNGPYAVNITQLPTESSFVAGTAQTQASTNAETLTFNGALFNSSPTTIILNVGNTLAQTVQQINSDPTMSQYVTASVNGSGDLELDSKKYGSIGAFTVSSSLAAASDTSGIGTSGGTATTGLDIAGTINGEAATGQGQFLTGTSGNPNTSGLEIQYTGNSTGLVGTMSFSSGVAANMANLALSFSNPVSGLIADANNGLGTQVTNDQSDITTMQAQLAVEQQNLQEQFAAMESAIAALQQQGQSLSAMLLASEGSSGSSSSSSSTGLTGSGSNSNSTSG